MWNFSEELRALNAAKIGGKTACITPLITTSAGPYASGDCIGGLITLEAAMSGINGTGILKSIFVKDNAGQSAALTILLFNTSPTGMTTTDNSAFAYGSAAALFQQIAKINIAADDYETINSKSVANLDTLSTVVQANGNSNLYMVVITTGSPTYAANNSTLSITLSFLQD